MTAAFGTTVSVTFDEPINPASVTASSFTLRDAGDALVPATVIVLGRIATLTPDAPLAYSSTYTALIAAGVMDLTGNATAGDYSWSFTTLDAPPPPRTRAREDRSWSSPPSATPSGATAPRSCAPRG